MSLEAFELAPEQAERDRADRDSHAAARARQLDAAVVRIARSRGAVELALGEALARLFDCDGTLQLGYSRRVDYSRERLGIPPRTMYGWVRLARAVEGRPLLRKAVRDGSVTPHKALAVSPLAVEDDEARWVAVAARLPLKELAALVQVNGAEAPEGYGDVENLILNMTSEHQEFFEHAIRTALEQSGFGAQRWQCVEMICQEWLGVFGNWQPDWETEASPTSLSEPARCVAKQLRRIGDAHQPLKGRESPVELDARIQKLLEGRRGFDVAFGAAAHALTREGAWAPLGYRCTEEYCRERLGTSPRAFRERVWLERRMCALPPLRAALERGRLSYAKALLVAKDANPSDVEARIADASVTTWQETERESTEKERRQDRARGVLRLWGPRDALRTVALAIASAQAFAEACGLGRIESGEALALIGLHFLSVWDAHKQRVPGLGRPGLRRPGPRRREVLQRNGGLCAVPGCSRPAQHEHHLIYRAHGGSDDPSNLIGLCAMHHLRGVHGGWLRVSGVAGELLEWQFGDGEEWITIGKHDRAVGEEVHQRRNRSA